MIFKLIMIKNLISNNCIAGYIYEFTNSIYDHPFMWSTIKYDSFNKLIDLYNEIDFNNINIQQTILNKKYWGNTFAINIDNKDIYINYIHHIQDDNIKKLEIKKERNGNNLYYYDMKNYLKNLYLKRSKRMTENKIKEPIFIIGKTGFYSDDEFYKLIYKKTIYKKIICLPPNFTIDMGGIYPNTYIINIPQDKLIEDKCATYLINNFKELLEII